MRRGAPPAARRAGTPLMLKLRIASGLALAVVMIAAIWYLPTPWLAAFLLLLSLLAAREWAKLSGIVTRGGWLLYAITVSATVAAPLGGIAGMAVGRSRSTGRCHGLLGVSACGGVGIPPLSLNTAVETDDDRRRSDRLPYRLAGACGGGQRGARTRAPNLASGGGRGSGYRGVLCRPKVRATPTGAPW